jgi:hypothetical protein
LERNVITYSLLPDHFANISVCPGNFILAIFSAVLETGAVITASAILDLRNEKDVCKALYDANPENFVGYPVFPLQSGNLITETLDDDFCALLGDTISKSNSGLICLIVF